MPEYKAGKPEADEVVHWYTDRDGHGNIVLLAEVSGCVYRVLKIKREDGQGEANLIRSVLSGDVAERLGLRTDRIGQISIPGFPPRRDES